MLINEEQSADLESAVMRTAIVTTLIALSLVVIFMKPDEGEQTVQTVEAAPQEQVTPEPTPQPKVESKLTIEEQKAQLIADNPNDCDMASQWIVWPSGECSDKQVAKPTQTAPQAVSQPTGDCHTWMQQAGITNPGVAYTLIMRESGCNPNAVNPSSGACGIGQQRPCGKWPHTWNDPVGGMIDMQNYVFGRYGSWEAALSWWDSHHWY